MRAAIIALAIAATSAHAISPAITAATRGSTPQQQATPQRRAAAACFWQVPRKQQWVNISALQSFSVVEAGQVIPRYGEQARQRYALRLVYDYRTPYVDVPIDLDENVGDLPRSVLARLEECAGGGNSP